MLITLMLSAPVLPTKLVPLSELNSVTLPRIATKRPRGFIKAMDVIRAVQCTEHFQIGGSYCSFWFIDPGSRDLVFAICKQKWTPKKKQPEV